MWHLAVYLAQQRVPRDAAEVVLWAAVTRQEAGGSTSPVSWAQARGMLDRAYEARARAVEPAVELESMHVMELDEFLSTPEPEYVWSVPRLLERQDRLIVTGEEGAGKTMWLIQMGMQCASGIHPVTLEPMPPLRVLVVDLENTEAQLKRPLRKLRQLAGDRYQGTLFVESEVAGLDLIGSRKEDCAWLDRIVSTCRPDLLIIGPTYKMATGDWEQHAQAIQSVIDALRGEYGCGVLLEAHTGQASNGDRRPHRPIGAARWLRWPEFGIHLAADGALSHWRGPRDREREWPARLRKGDDHEWPWSPAGGVDGSRVEVPAVADLSDVQKETLQIVRNEPGLSKSQITEWRGVQTAAGTLKVLKWLESRGLVRHDDDWLWWPR